MDDIIGGVIGGVMGLGLLGAILYWYMLHRRRIAQSGAPLPSLTDQSSVEGSGTDMTQYLANTLPTQSSSAVSEPYRFRTLAYLLTYLTFKNTSSLAIPGSAVLTSPSHAGSTRSMGPSNV